MNTFAASLDDLEGLDLEAPLPANEYHACDALSEFYQKAATEAGSEATATGRVFGALAALCAFLPTYDNPTQPYQPRGLIFPDELPEPFLLWLEEVYPRLRNSALRARIGDALFLRLRKREIWPETVAAYISAAQEIAIGDPWHAVPLFQRALQIAARLGRKNKPWQGASAAVVVAARTACASEPTRYCSRVLSVLQDHRIGDAEEWATASESLAAKAEAAAQPDIARTFWQLAEAWWRKGHNEPRADAARLREAETYAAEAEIILARPETSYGMAAGFFAKALIALRQALAPAPRIAEIRKRLAQAQKESIGEMRPVTGFDRIEKEFARETEEAGRRARKCVTHENFEIALQRLACAPLLIDPVKHREDVIEGVNQAPFLHMLPASYKDSQGRTMRRSAGLMYLRGEEQEAALKDEMFREAVKWKWTRRAAGWIEPGRRKIWSDHQPTLRDLDFVVHHSAFVPAGQALSVQRGILAGLSGDWLAAAHLLAPKMEGAIRHVLELNGGEVANLLSDETQPLKTLNPLLDLPETTNIFGESLMFEFRGLLNEAAGYNLRNALAHSLLSDQECIFSGAAMNLWWLMLRLCLQVHVVTGLEEQ